MSAEHNLTDNDYELLSAYIDEMLDDAERSAVEQRLREEPLLRRELAALRQTVALLRRLPTLKAPRDFTLPVTPAAVRDSAPTLTLAPTLLERPRTLPRRRPLPLVSVLSAAAAVVLILAGVGLLLAPAEAPDATAGAVAGVVTSAPQALLLEQTEAQSLTNNAPFERGTGELSPGAGSGAGSGGAERSATTATSRTTAQTTVTPPPTFGSVSALMAASATQLPPPAPSAAEAEAAEPLAFSSAEQTAPADPTEEAAMAEMMDAAAAESAPQDAVPGTDGARALQASPPPLTSTPARTQTQRPTATPSVTATAAPTVTPTPEVPIADSITAESSDDSADEADNEADDGADRDVLPFALIGAGTVLLAGVVVVNLRARGARRA